MVTTMRASSPADLVAAAVAMLQVVPTSSMCAADRTGPPGRGFAGAGCDAVAGSGR
jgi:hypothetical protein